MTTFDAPERTDCTVRRIRTNTPLQALVTLNDPVYVGSRSGTGPPRRGALGQPGRTARFRLSPRADAPAERGGSTAADGAPGRGHAQFRKDPVKAAALATKPLGPVPPGVAVADLAAWTVVGNVLLNLDEALAKP